MSENPKPPVLLIDIDGVINVALSHEAMDAIDVGFRSDLPHERHQFSPYQWIYAGKHLPAMIAELKPHFELQWGTAWGPKAANEMVLPILGLDEPLEGIEYVTIAHKVYVKMSGISYVDGSMPDFWKQPWLEQWADDNPLRPMIFIDDEISEEAMMWAEERTEAGVPTLLIKTDDAIGWTQEHTDEMIQWAEDLPELT